MFNFSLKNIFQYFLTSNFLTPKLPVHPMKKILLVIGSAILATGCATNSPSTETPAVSAANLSSSAGGGQSSLPTLPTDIPDTPSPSDNADVLKEKNLTVYKPVYKTKFKAKSVTKAKLPKRQTATGSELETKLATHKLVSEKSSKSVHKSKAALHTTATKTDKALHKATSKLKTKSTTHKATAKKSNKPEHKAKSEHKNKHKSKN